MSTDPNAKANQSPTAKTPVPGLNVGGPGGRLPESDTGNAPKPVEKSAEGDDPRPADRAKQAGKPAPKVKAKTKAEKQPKSDAEKAKDRTTADKMTAADKAMASQKADKTDVDSGPAAAGDGQPDDPQPEDKVHLVEGDPPPKLSAKEAEEAAKTGGVIETQYVDADGKTVHLVIETDSFGHAVSVVDREHPKTQVSLPPGLTHMVS